MQAEDHIFLNDLKKLREKFEVRYLNGKDVNMELNPSLNYSFFSCC